jgi:hypothetical protein
MWFEKNDKGDFVGFLAVPEQKLEKIPIIAATFSDGNLGITDISKSDIKGTLSDKVFDAELIQAEATSKIPVTFNKE